MDVIPLQTFQDTFNRATYQTGKMDARTARKALAIAVLQLQRSIQY